MGVVGDAAVTMIVVAAAADADVPVLGISSDKLFLFFGKAFARGPRTCGFLVVSSEGESVISGLRDDEPGAVSVDRLDRDERSLVIRIRSRRRAMPRRSTDGLCVSER